VAEVRRHDEPSHRQHLKWHLRSSLDAFMSPPLIATASPSCWSRSTNVNTQYAHTRPSLVQSYLSAGAQAGLEPASRKARDEQ